MRTFMAILLTVCGLYIILYASNLEEAQLILSAIGGFMAGSGIGSLLIICIED